MQMQNHNEIDFTAARVRAKALLMEQPAMGKHEESLRMCKGADSVGNSSSAPWETKHGLST